MLLSGDDIKIRFYWYAISVNLVSCHKRVSQTRLCLSKDVLMSLGLTYRYSGQPSFFNQDWPGVSIWKYRALRTKPWSQVKREWLVHSPAWAMTDWSMVQKVPLTQETREVAFWSCKPRLSAPWPTLTGSFDWWVSEIWLMSMKCREDLKSMLIMID